MSNIDELQRRITAAIDRVSTGLEKVSAGQAGPDPEMAQALEDERTANAQLTERVRALKTKSDAEMAGLRTQVEESEARMAQLDVELQRVRRANAALSDACNALREANEEGVGDSHLINQTMLAELEALRAARAADVAESNAILAALTPLVDAAEPETPAKEDTPNA
jgi:DNA repair exonuclease SbcCD ATPase subunit